MLILEPVKQFLVSRHLNNPSDTGTYYCKATISNSITGATIDSFNLTNNGSKYFSKSWMTPNDSSGTGLQITISITAYDDSGYTVESVVYGTDKKDYIVRSLAGSRVFGGYAGPGRGDFDYEKIANILLEKVKGGIKIPEQKEYDDSLILDELDVIKNKIESLPQKDRTDDVVRKILASSEFKLLRSLPSGFKDAEKSDDELHSYIESFLKKLDKDSKEFKDGISQSMTDVLSNEFKSKIIQPMITVATSEFRKNIESSMNHVMSEFSAEVEKMLSRPIPVELSVSGNKFSGQRESKEPQAPAPREHLRQLLNA